MDLIQLAKCQAMRRRINITLINGFLSGKKTVNSWKQNKKHNQGELMAFIINYAIKILTKLQKIIQKLSKPEPKINDFDMLEIKSIVKNGDTLLSYESWRLTAPFIPGEYKHAAIYLDGKVYEALDVGVRKVSLERFVLTKDLIAICRPDFELMLNYSAMIEAAEAYLGLPYDYQFSSHDQKAFYCSELCLNVYDIGFKANTGVETDIELRNRLGKMTIVPQDFYDMTQSKNQKFILKGVFNGKNS